MRSEITGIGRLAAIGVLIAPVVTRPGDVWVAGGQDNGTPGDPSWRPALAHWSPSGWSMVTIPGEDRVFPVGGNPSYDEDSQTGIWTRS